MEEYARKPAGRPVRIVIPAEVAFNLGHVHEAIDNLARQLGCPMCFSGLDCTFDLARNYIVNPESHQLEILPEG